jgi:hypothetical protein
MARMKSPRLGQHRKSQHDSVYTTGLPDGLMAVTASESKTPETLLEEAQEGPETRNLSELVGQDLGRLDELLDRLPATEADILSLWCMGSPPHSHHEIAQVLGYTQSNVSYRFTRAIQRLRWMTGPGGAFTAADIRRDLYVPLGDDAELLAVFWETTSYTQTGLRYDPARKMPPDRAKLAIGRALSRLRGLANRAPDLYEHYYDGIDLARTQGLGLALENGASADWVKRKARKAAK